MDKMLILSHLTYLKSFHLDKMLIRARILLTSNPCAGR